MEEMSQAAEAAEARRGSDGGFLRHRQLDLTKLKAEACKSLISLAGHRAQTKGTKN